MTALLQFYWLDGSSINSTYWANNEPNNYEGNANFINEGCLVTAGSGFNDHPCTIVHAFLCDVPLP